MDAHELDVQTVERLLADLHFPIEEYSEPGAPDNAPAIDTKQYTWARTCVTAPENPRLSRRFLANERRQIPALWFRQEWLCEFVALGDVVFSADDVAMLLRGDVQALPVMGQQEAVLTEGLTALPALNGWPQ